MRFRCASHPKLRLTAPSRGIEIRFRRGYYETDDKQEIRLLEREPLVTVVADRKSAE